MTRLAILTLLAVIAADMALAGPAEISKARKNPTVTAAQIACAQFVDQDRVQRPQPVAFEGSLVISTHGPRQQR